MNFQSINVHNAIATIVGYGFIQFSLNLSKYISVYIGHCVLVYKQYKLSIDPTYSIKIKLWFFDIHFEHYRKMTAC